MMDGGGAYGAGKAGVAFDPLQFLTRPQVIVRALCLLFSIIVFGCISSQGYVYDKDDDREVCLYNGDNNACNYGVAIGVIAFLASIIFIVGEFLFPNMSSVKTRKHYVIGDLAFSGFWAFLYFVGFCYLTNQWGSSKTPEGGYGVNNVQAAIAFSFFSIFTWGGCAWFAFQRFRQGVDSAFAPSYEADQAAGGQGQGAAPTYTSYPGAPDPEGGYREVPFSGGNQTKGPGMEFDAPAY